MDSQSYVLSPAAVAMPVLACFTMIINIAPFIWHVKNRNLAAASLVFWIVLTLFFDFINALIWPKDDIANWFKGFILCDIEVKLMLAATVGIPGSLASIMRNLAMVLNTEKPVLMRTTAQRRRQLIIDSLFSFGFPVYMMAIHYVVQPSRYYIYAIAGCVVSFDDSWPTVVLMWIWPSMLSLVGVFYSVLVVMRMHKYRQEFSAIISSTGSNLTKSRFKRLFFMSATLTLIVLPVQFYVLSQNTSYPFIRYDWNAIHGVSWQNIIMVPTGGVVYYDRWVHISIGFGMFFFFGLGADAVKMYRGWLLACGFDKFFPGLHHQTSSPRKISTTSSTRAFFATRARRFFTKSASGGSSIAPLTVDTSRHDSTSTYIQSPSPSDPSKSFPPRPVREHKPTSSIDSIDMDEKNSSPAPRQVKIPYLASFISAFRTPESSRQMAKREMDSPV